MLTRPVGLLLTFKRLEVLACAATRAPVVHDKGTSSGIGMKRGEKGGGNSTILRVGSDAIAIGLYVGFPVLYFRLAFETLKTAHRSAQNK